MEYLETKILETFPDVDEKKIDVLLEAEIARSGTKLVVLDDDPTGVQTVHDISVFTNWDIESIRLGFEENNKTFYILTNSRGMTEAETIEVHKKIASLVARVAEETGKSYLLISRSDSTLRGHYPIETETLKETLEKDGFLADGEILCPFFKEGGRFTLNNIHYVQQGDKLIPAAQTEFAKDKTFGYCHSAIPEYIEEKTKGKYIADNVVCISLQSLRAVELDFIERQLLETKNFNKICVDAADYCDIKVFAVALYRAMAKGKRFIFRTAASFVKVMGGISDIPLLTHKDMFKKKQKRGGIIIVGSYTQKTTKQLEKLLTLENVIPVEMDSDKVLEGDNVFYDEVRRCVAEEEKIIFSGKNAVCFTRRRLLTLENDTGESALVRSMKISDGVQRLVAQLQTVPAFIIAKGGITSSDIGTKALLVKRANVMGQICPGIPVWKTGAESKFPNIPYVIFPGNTGEEDTLRRAVEIMTGNES